MTKKGAKSLYWLCVRLIEKGDITPITAEKTPRPKQKKDPSG